ncbi:MAG: transcription antitermination factor NusB [Gammaproteobacteria bacterium]|nr:transcription antitermination factor NusB [Gammaproteobacteria bacterium]NND39689.1 transcription antitermination factor NusB [Pseudomonadales bacterium]MBT8149992.1 transcription antitermination factor NusB [Gammaproteobacteria bacterium]NNL11156.1 transcription antitermination factor NusB [Pseudomonadales bacterium]NNM10806.1 transcription antitermination factor NusB [Pseudomonadales bacterium]
MQGLYQNHLNASSASDIEAQFRVDFDMQGTDLEYFRELLAGVQREKDQLDAELLPLATERKLEECDPVTLALLRLGTYELKHRIDVPYKVAINESVNLAKKFGPQDAHKFVNAVLDRAALQLRQSEIADHQR